MILFPNCKINIGLQVLGKRPDGYHNIASLMVPVPWTDVLEIVPSQSGETHLHTSGRSVDCPEEKNLVMKAYHALNEALGCTLPPVDIYLEKIIPDGAGLGGGSSDAAFTLVGLNKLFNLGFADDKLAEIAASLGADCPFFIYNVPAMVSGTGTTITPTPFTALDGKTLLIAKPDGISVSTREAYAGVMQGALNNPPALSSILNLPMNQWQENLYNDFERTVFPLAPKIAEVKESMIANGAIYAAMSGSGAAVFGIFDNDNMAEQVSNALRGCVTHICKNT